MDEEDMFFQAGFFKYSTTEGDLTVNVMGFQQKLHYVSENYLNARRNIGYSKVTAEGLDSYIFLSRTKDGDILTLPGNATGPLDLDLEGVRTVWGVDMSLPVEDCYCQHLQAICFDDVLQDEEYLKAEVPKLPQRNMDVALKAVDTVFQSMGGMEGMMDVMKKAMEGMMDSFAQGMKEGPEGKEDMDVIDLDKEEGQEDGAPPEKPGQRPRPKKDDAGP